MKREQKQTLEAKHWLTLSSDAHIDALNPEKAMDLKVEGNNFKVVQD